MDLAQILVQFINIINPPIRRPLVTSVTDEAPILVDLAAYELPVPELLWVESDPSVFGAAAIATAAASGSADASIWADDRARLERIVRNSAKVLASMHAVAPDQLTSKGSGVPGGNGNSPVEFARDLGKFLRSLDSIHKPLAERVIGWLEENAPPDFGRTSVVHGDYGLHNLLIDDDRLTAVLDWEFWHVGDPREDLAYIRPFMDEIDAWPVFSAAYVEAGGVEIDEQVGKFYAVLSTARVALGGYALQHAFAHGNPSIDSKMVYVGRSFADHFMIEAAKLASS